MKKQTNIEKEIATKIALEEFNNPHEKHEFSDHYKNRKETFLHKINEDKHRSWSKKKIMIAIALSLFLIPTTVFAASEIYQWYVTQQQYKLTLSIKGQSDKSSDYYKLNLGYLPENMVGGVEGSTKYSYKDNYAQGGFSFVLLKIKNEAEFTEINTKNYQKVTYGKNKGYLINKEGFNVNAEGGFARVVYLMFEEEGYVVETYIGNDVPEHDLEKVLANLSLKKTRKEEADFYIDYEEYKKDFKDEPKKDGIQDSKLSLKNPNLYKIGESTTVNDINFIVNKVEVLDDIKEMTPTNFKDSLIEDLTEKQILSENLTLQPYKQKTIKVGNGTTTIDKVIAEKITTVKFVYLTTTIENTGKNEIDDLYLQNSPQLVKQKGNNFVHATSYDEIPDFTVYSGEVDYLDNHGDGDSFYKLPPLKGKEKRIIHFGFFMDENQLNQMILPVLNYSNPEDLSDRDAKWIDIRS